MKRRLLLSFVLSACAAPPVNSDANDDAAIDSNVADSVSSDANTNETATTAVSIRFRAVVGTEPFACGRTYNMLGRPASTWEPRDFRFYVHNVRLVTADGREAPVTLTSDDRFQSTAVALLDFEDASGNCRMGPGTTETNDTIRGTVSQGNYTRLRFTVGVPFEQNHQDTSVARAPLNLTAMWWNWNGGYKFAKIDGTTAGLPLFNIHVGSTGCEGNSMGPMRPCTAPNRAEITIENFDPTRSVVVADLAQLVNEAALDTNTANTPAGCMSSPTDPDCAPIFASLGLQFGMNSPSQRFFRAQ